MAKILDLLQGRSGREYGEGGALRTQLDGTISLNAQNEPGCGVKAVTASGNITNKQWVGEEQKRCVVYQNLTI